MSICKSKTAHGSKLGAHSKKENYEKDITSHISIIIIGDDICAEQRHIIERDIRLCGDACGLEDNRRQQPELVAIGN
jgi:hypothetical protein